MSRSRLFEGVDSRLSRTLQIVLPGEEEDFAFDFPEPEKLAGSHGALVLQGVEFGYKAADSSDKPTKILFENLDFSVNMDSRTVIVGPNGEERCNFA